MQRTSSEFASEPLPLRALLGIVCQPSGDGGGVVAAFPRGEKSPTREMTLAAAPPAFSADGGRKAASAASPPAPIRVSGRRKNGGQGRRTIPSVDLRPILRLPVGRLTKPPQIFDWWRFRASAARLQRRATCGRPTIRVLVWRAGATRGRPAIRVLAQPACGLGSAPGTHGIAARKVVDKKVPIFLDFHPPLAQGRESGKVTRP